MCQNSCVIISNVFRILAWLVRVVLRNSSYGNYLRYQLTVNANMADKLKVSGGSYAPHTTKSVPKSAPIARLLLLHIKYFLKKVIAVLLLK